MYPEIMQVTKFVSMDFIVYLHIFAEIIFKQFTISFANVHKSLSNKSLFL